MKIKTKIAFKEYRKLLFSLTYRKPIMKVILGVAFAMVVWILGYYLRFLPVPRPQIYQYITLILITVIQPVVIYFTIRRNYNSSNHLKEPLEIEFNNKDIKVRGESFYTELTWEKTYNVTELTNWFLIYQNNFSAIIVPKKSFIGNQKEEFRQLLKSLGQTPVHLKKP
jgi:hypothetical protein